MQTLVPAVFTLTLISLGSLLLQEGGTKRWGEDGGGQAPRGGFSIPLGTAK
jgi:hypothetical protein